MAEVTVSTGDDLVFPEVHLPENVLKNTPVKEVPTRDNDSRADRVHGLMILADPNTSDGDIDGIFIIGLLAPLVEQCNLSFTPEQIKDIVDRHFAANVVKGKTPAAIKREVLRGILFHQSPYNTDVVRSVMHAAALHTYVQATGMPEHSVGGIIFATRFGSYPEYGGSDNVRKVLDPRDAIKPILEEVSRSPEPHAILRGDILDQLFLIDQLNIFGYSAVEIANIIATESARPGNFHELHEKYITHRMERINDIRKGNNLRTIDGVRLKYSHKNMIERQRRALEVGLVDSLTRIPQELDHERLSVAMVRMYRLLVERADGNVIRRLFNRMGTDVFEELKAAYLGLPSILQAANDQISDKRSDPVRDVEEN